MIAYSPERRVSQALLLVLYKEVLLFSSFLDSSDCSWIYFSIASSVILPIVDLFTTAYSILPSIAGGLAFSFMYVDKEFLYQSQLSLLEQGLHHIHILINFLLPITFVIHDGIVIYLH